MEVEGKQVRQNSDLTKSNGNSHTICPPAYGRLGQALLNLYECSRLIQ